jgi:hypothetical protein
MSQQKAKVCGPVGQKKTVPLGGNRFDKKEFGGDLLSHTVTRAVPSALRGLTSVFEMGTGVTPSL